MVNGYLFINILITHYSFWNFQGHFFYVFIKPSGIYLLGLSWRKKNWFIYIFMYKMHQSEREKMAAFTDTSRLHVLPPFNNIGTELKLVLYYVQERNRREEVWVYSATASADLDNHKKAKMDGRPKGDGET